MSISKYDSMKDSGVEWIGEIPEHWNIKKIRYVVQGIISGPFGSDLKKESYVSMGYKIYGQEQVISGDLNFGDYYISKEKFEQMRRFQVKSNDILVSCVGTFGKIALMPELIEEGIINPRLIKISPIQKEILPEFLYLYLKSWVVFSQLDEYSRGGTMDIINSTILSNILVSLPTLKEQQQIASYLDKKTTETDNEIEKNQKLIKLLKEKRQSTINQAVTKGLDPSIPMKDSGVEWIGEIPECWIITKIKFTSYVKGRIGWQGLRSEEFTDQGAFLITGTDFKEGRINWDTCHHVEDWRYEQDPYIQIQKNDILITKDGTIGKVALIDKIPDRTTLNSGVMVVRPKNNKYIPTFLYWILSSSQFIDFIEMIKSGSTISHLYQETFGNFSFTLPKISEQQQIAEFLDKQTTKIDSLISKVELQIKQLQEFRESLVTSAIIGKIKVIA